MELSRRKFSQMLGSISFLCFADLGALFIGGCSTVWQDIIAYAPVGISAVTNLLNLLGTFGIIPVGSGTAAAALISSITTLFNDVVADVKLYQSEPANATLAQKIQDELQAIGTQVSSFLAGLTFLGTSTEAKIIQALLSLFLSTLAGFISAVAAKAGAAAQQAIARSRRTVMIGGQTLLIEPKYRKRAEFVKEWNAEVDAAGHSEIELK